MTLEIRACRRIHTIMYVTMTTAAALTTVSSTSCWCSGRPAENQLRSDGECDAQGDSDRDANEHLPNGVRASALAEERGDDTDHEGGFDAFAKTDDECREHVDSLLDCCAG